MAIASEDPPDSKRFRFDIPAQPLGDALRHFGKQSGREVFFPSGEPEWQLQTQALIGLYTEKAALAKLLAGMPVRAHFEPPKLWTFHLGKTAAPENTVMPPDAAEPRRSEAGIPDVLIEGSRSLNADIARLRNGPQDVIVLTERDIALSGAMDLPAFLRTRLPLHHPVPGLSGGDRSVAAEVDQVNVRAMGYNQTLVLIDGRRTAGRTFGGDALQPDLAAIPLDAVERIEVLPGTASAIYGGSAVAATINIVRRRSEPGTTTVTVLAERSSDAHSAEQKIWLEHVTALAGGNGQVAISGTLSTRPAVLAGDRNFLTRGLERIEANHPAYFDSISLPPLGARPNVRSVAGTPLVPGSTATRLFIPGGFSSEDGLDELTAAAGRYDFGLADTPQAHGAARSALRAAVDVKSLGLTAAGNLSSSWSADLDVWFAEITRSAPASGADFSGVRRVVLPAEAPTNPFGQDVFVTLPIAAGDGISTHENTTGRATAAIVFRPAKHHAIRLEHTHSISRLTIQRPGLEVDPLRLAGGDIDILRSPLTEEDLGAVSGTFFTTPLRSVADSTTLSFAGPAFPLPAGTATVSMLAERRREVLAKGTAREELMLHNGEPPIVQNVVPEQRQTVESLYAELNLPLLKGMGANAKHELLSGLVSVRRDAYRVQPAASHDLSGMPAAFAMQAPEERANPRFHKVSWMGALRVQPTSWFVGRASCGTGFLPPPMSLLTEPLHQLVPLTDLTDPARGSEPLGLVNVLAGGNPDLKPEESKSWSAGVILGAVEGAGFRLSLDYTRLSKSAVIFTPSELLFSAPRYFMTAFPARVHRAEPAADDPWGVGPIEEIDASSMNLATLELRAFDLQLDYTREATPVGDVRFSMLATYQPVMHAWMDGAESHMHVPGVVAVARPRYRANALLSFSKGGWDGGWSAVYIPKYIVSDDEIIRLNQGGRQVRPQQFHDVHVGYTFPEMTRWGAQLHLRLDAHNVFRSKPAFDAAEPGFASRYGVAELPSYGLSIRASF